jgi:hypothetical protein
VKADAAAWLARPSESAEALLCRSRDGNGERAIAYYKERDRQREERKLKEGKEAIAREVAERNRREGSG